MTIRAAATVAKEEADESIGGTFVQTVHVDIEVAVQSGGQPFDMNVDHLQDAISDYVQKWIGTGINEAVTGLYADRSAGGGGRFYWAPDQMPEGIGTSTTATMTLRAKRPVVITLADLEIPVEQRGVKS